MSTISDALRDLLADAVANPTTEGGGTVLSIAEFTLRGADTALFTNDNYQTNWTSAATAGVVKVTNVPFDLEVGVGGQTSDVLVHIRLSAGNSTLGFSATPMFWDVGVWPGIQQLDGSLTSADVAFVSETSEFQDNDLLHFTELTYTAPSHLF